MFIYTVQTDPRVTSCGPQECKSSSPLFFLPTQTQGKALKRFVLNKLNGDTVKWRRYRRSLLKHTAAMQKLKYQFLNINNNNKKRLKVQIKIKTNFIEEIKYNRDYREYSRSFLALLFILYKRLFQSIVATKLQVSCKDGCWQAAIP